MEPAAPSEPADPRRARDDLDVGARLVQERRELDGALPGPDDRRARSAVVVHRPQRRRMARLRRLEVGELHRAMGEGVEPGRDNHAAGGECLAILEHDAESCASALEPPDAAAIEVGHGALLEPLPVADEVVTRHRPGERHTVLLLIRVEAERALRVRDRRRLPRGTKQHPDRHPPLPEVHSRPSTWTSRPCARRCAAAASPYGPAPMTATSWSA